MNCSFGVLRAIRYIATGGDQIELNPPRKPERTPTPICHLKPGPIGREKPKSRFAEKMIMAKPITTVRKPVGKAVMFHAVIKMLTIIASAKYLYFFAVCTRSLDLVN